MPLQDLREHATGTQIPADVCIIGAGPAGMTIALELAPTAASIVLVESGAAAPRPDVEDLSEIENVGMARAPQAVTRARVLGGTSSLWTGRSGILDEIDYAARPWVPNSGWPIGHDDVAPYVNAASSLLGLGPARYRGLAIDRLVATDGATWDRRLLLPAVFQFSVADPAVTTPAPMTSTVDDPGAEHAGAFQHTGAPPPVHFWTRHGPSLLEHPNVRVLTHATACDVITQAAGRAVTGVEVTTLDGRRSTVVAATVVLACGGIDNARLLLASRQTNPAGVGNDRDLVGRFLMDHPYAPIAAYAGGGDRGLRRRFGHLWADANGSRQVYSFGVRLSPVVQRDEELLNAEVIAVDEGDVRAPLRRAHDAARALLDDGLGREGLAELAAALSRPDRLAWNGYERWVLGRPSLSDAARVVFGCVVEQVPDRSSRVTLSELLDVSGQPRARIDWRASDAEYATLTRMVAILGAEARRLGHDPPEVLPWVDDGVDAWREQVHDMAHPIGTTRMSVDPMTGVVDARGRVHGVAGLFVAGSSTFPTSGYMNPTLMIVALALRLADHLKADLPGRTATAITTSSGRAPTRVGFVGYGDRVRRFHLPVVQAMPDRFDAVGFVARSSETRARGASETGIAAFSSAREMIDAVAPDFLVVAVGTDAVDDVVPTMIDLGVPVLVETPLCWNLKVGRQAVRQIRSSGQLFGVAEQTPHLPLEQLKRKVIELGMVGRLDVVHNDGAVYDYHGLAALRAYLGGGRRPRSVSAISVAGSDGPLVRATVAYDDGALLVHEFDEGRDGALVISGSRGVLTDAGLVTRSPDGRPVTMEIERLGDGGRLRALVLRSTGGDVWWHNPFADVDLTDEQIAVASVLVDFRDAVLTGKEPAYTASDALADMEILTAMRYSVRQSGRSIALPISRVDQGRALITRLVRHA